MKKNTGYTDINGREIYVGDIIADDEKNKHVVAYDKRLRYAYTILLSNKKSTFQLGDDDCTVFLPYTVALDKQHSVTI